MGNPLDKNTDIGAINSQAEYEKIQKLIDSGKAEGGEYFEPKLSVPHEGFFHKPCFFNNVSSAFTLSRTEVFGPVLAISTFLVLLKKRSWKQMIPSMVSLPEFGQKKDQKSIRLRLHEGGRHLGKYL